MPLLPVEFCRDVCTLSRWQGFGSFVFYSCIVFTCDGWTRQM